MRLSDTKHSVWKISVVLTILFLWVSTSLASPGIEPKRVVLKNGITLLFVETHALPMVNISVAIRAGAVYDPQEKGGVASLTAALLDEGTRGRSSRQIAEEIDFIGGRLSSSGGEDISTASLVVLKKDLATGMDLLSDILLNPVFPEEELERKKKETIAAIISEKDDPGAVASKAFYKAVFQGHPYGMPVEGDEESVSRITRDDIINFYQKFYKPNNTIIAVTGDLKYKEALSLIETSFKQWKKSKLKLPEVPSVKKVMKSDSILIDRNITQANIVLGHTGISRDNPDYYAVTLMNYILGGGGFESRMTRDIRDKKGLAYSVYSRFDVNKYSGAFSVELQTKNETAREAIAGIREELKKIREEKVKDDELKDAKAYLTGSFPLRLDTNSKISNFLVLVEFYNLGLDYVNEYARKIDSVTKDDILRVARKYIDADNYITVVVGKQEKTGLQP
ncbi:MAG: insulinase family protein [Nitrospirae bacterium]|nr:insulinase family protein [Nitrospirota bacterium]